MPKKVKAVKKKPSKGKTTSVQQRQSVVVNINSHNRNTPRKSKMQPTNTTSFTKGNAYTGRPAYSSSHSSVFYPIPQLTNDIVNRMTQMENLMKNIQVDRQNAERQLNTPRSLPSMINVPTTSPSQSLRTDDLLNETTSEASTRVITPPNSPQAQASPSTSTGLVRGAISKLSKVFNSSPYDLRDIANRNMVYDTMTVEQLRRQYQQRFPRRAVPGDSARERARMIKELKTLELPR